MIYSCAHCTRTFECAENISYCPFCGNAYGATVSVSQNQVRIVIGSDSEKTIQEKYWHMARYDLISVLEHLQENLRSDDERQKQKLDFMEWLHQQRKCRSVLQFKKNCDSYLLRLHQASKSKKEETHPIDVQSQTERIDELCYRLAEALGSIDGHISPPELYYEETSAHQPSESKPQDLPQGYDQLLETLENSKHSFYRILEENGLYVALSMIGEIENDIKKDPLLLSNEIKVLSLRDYDPLFGEEYDDYIIAFYEGTMLLSTIINNLFKLPETDDAEEEKIKALENYIDLWHEKLGMILDQTYQAQELNMMYVYSDVNSILKEMEKDVE